MEGTGKLTFKRLPDGSLSHEWTGGRRIEIANELLKDYLKLPAGEARRINVGFVFRLEGYTLRVVALGHSARLKEGHWCSSVICMRDGLLAKITALYVRSVLKLVPRILDQECRVLHLFGYYTGDGMAIPSWTLSGFLLRWI